MPAPTERVLFNRLARLAAESGYTAEKVEGGYRLRQGDWKVAGEPRPMDLQGLAHALQKLHVLKRG